jgi:hypothetical protein
MAAVSAAAPTQRVVSVVLPGAALEGRVAFLPALPRALLLRVAAHTPEGRAAGRPAIVAVKLFNRNHVNAADRITMSRLSRSRGGAKNSDFPNTSENSRRKRQPT